MWMKMAAPSTKQKLLSLVEDVEIVTKELFEVMCVPKSQRSEGVDTSQLIELLVAKDKEIKQTLKIVEQQAETQQKLDLLKAEVAQRDVEIQQLQKSLKEAEGLLSNAIYQARQKLTAIGKANQNRISSEELIRYAHKISASNAVAAPPTWAPGDPRRPYPTEIEMRGGFLGRLSDLPVSNQSIHSQGHLSDILSGGTGHSQLEHALSSGTHTSAQAPSMSWQTSSEHGVSSLAAHAHLKHNDVEEMNSSDSSSSSSSDE